MFPFPISIESDDFSSCFHLHPRPLRVLLAHSRNKLSLDRLERPQVKTASEDGRTLCVTGLTSPDRFSVVSVVVSGRTNLKIRIGVETFSSATMASVTTVMMVVVSLLKGKAPRTLF